MINDQKIQKDMEAAGIKKDPIQNVYTQAQKDDFLRNKKNDQDALVSSQKNTSQDYIANNIKEKGTENASLKLQQGIDGAISSKDKDRMAEAENFYDDKKNTQENTDKLINEGSKELEAPELQEDDVESAEAEEAVTNAVATAGKNPTDIVRQVYEDFGYHIKFDKNGKVIPLTQSQWQLADKTGRIAMLGTALSCIVSAISGGNIPPVNFNKIAGVDKQYTQYLKGVDDLNQAFAKTMGKSEDTKLAKELQSLPPETLAIYKQIETGYADELAKAQKMLIDAQASGDVRRIQAQEEAMASLLADKLAKIQEGLEEGLYDKNSARFMARAAMADQGETMFNKVSETVRNYSDSAADLLTGLTAAKSSK